MRKKNEFKKNILVKKNTNKVEISNSKLTILKSFKVHKESELLEFLFSHILNDSKNNIKKYLSNHQVLVNGSSISQFNFMVYKEDLIQICKEPVLKQKTSKMKLDIIYEDDEIIVINKPSGILSVESDHEKTNTAYRLVNDYVQQKDKKNRIFIVHRIDKDTSGVLLFAKNESIKNKLSHQWQEIVSKREYVAICEGKFKEKSGTIKSYLKNNINNLMYSTNSPSGQLAITHYKVLKENLKYSLVDVCIDSGRKNQIRVHMKDLNHPVVGDEKYGITSNPINRLGLHAYVLELTHPVTLQKMVFKAKIPPCFNVLFLK